MERSLEGLTCLIFCSFYGQQGGPLGKRGHHVLERMDKVAYNPDRLVNSLHAFIRQLPN
jgi:hypothetical protein